MSKGNASANEIKGKLKATLGMITGDRPMQTSAGAAAVRQAAGNSVEGGRTRPQGHKALKLTRARSEMFARRHACHGRNL
ncbi:uncharacterized protein YjbJ (UPF0337 family) [Streptomyces sp. V1I1]|nr:uncharacterized protein YjbJ (UPF0337 family) [Streptomyces sp. V1I1]